MDNIDHNNKVPYNYSSPYVLGPRLALALPVVMPVADIYYYIFFYRPRDHTANNNKGEGRKSAHNNYATLGLGDMQHKQSDNDDQLNLPSRSARKVFGWA